MKPTVFLRALPAAALLAIAARPAAAQTPAQAGQPTAASAAPTPWPARPIGRYELELAMPDKQMPVTVVIADSAGVPAAVVQPDGDPEAHAFKITNNGTELYLNAVAPKGAVELVLVRTGDLISGRWSFADDKGTLKGKVDK